MPKIDDGDIEDIMSNGDWDDVAVFTIAAGDTLSVNGWFQEKTEAAPFPGGDIEVVDASFTCPTSQVTTVKNEMTVVINGDTYTVKRKQNIGTGTTLIYLKT